MDAINTSLLCNIANTTGNFVKKTGDTMTGNLLMNISSSTPSAMLRVGLPVSTDIENAGTNQFSAFFGSSGEGILVSKYSNDSSGPSFMSFNTRRTADTTADTILVNADRLLFVSGYGSDGVNYIISAGILMFVDGVTGLNDMPGRILLSTTLDGAAASTTKWSIMNTGLLTGGSSMYIQKSTPVPAGGTSGVGYVFSATANFGAFFGSGLPTLSAAQGSLYLRTDGGSSTTRAYLNTNGAATWTAITTVA